jgi:hypothetical protein
LYAPLTGSIPQIRNKKRRRMNKATNSNFMVNIASVSIIYICFLFLISFLTNPGNKKNNLWLFSVETPSVNALVDL